MNAPAQVYKTHPSMTVAIVGIGLMGGSLAIALQENGFADEIIGVDVSRDNLDKALRRKLIGRDLPLAPAIAQADVVVVSTPVDALAELIPRILEGSDDSTVVIDLGSTKEQLLNQLADHPHRPRYVAAHPMAGTEYSGPEAAIPHLYESKVCVLVDAQDSSPEALQTARRLFGSLGMQLTDMQREEHDLHTAYVSHISHIVGFGLALTVLEKEKDEARIFELASSGFASTVRLAKSSPDMWVPIFRQNRDNVLDVLDEYIEQLSRFRSLLIKRDFDTFYQRIEAANQIKKIIG